MSRNSTRMIWWSVLFFIIKKRKHFEYDDDTGLWWRYGWVQHDDQLFKENYEMNDDDDDDDAGLGWWCNGGKVIWEEIWG